MICVGDGGDVVELVLIGVGECARGVLQDVVQGGEGGEPGRREEGGGGVEGVGRWCESRAESERWSESE